VDYAGGRSDGCTSWSPSDARQIIGTEADDVKAQSQPQRIISPIDAFHAWSDAATMTIAAPSKIRKSRDRLGRALGLPKHW
jgi:hypothetical protein